MICCLRAEQDSSIFLCWFIHHEDMTGSGPSSQQSARYRGAAEVKSYFIVKNRREATSQYTLTKSVRLCNRACAHSFDRFSLLLHAGPKMIKFTAETLQYITYCAVGRKATTDIQCALGDTILQTNVSNIYV